MNKTTQILAVMFVVVAAFFLWTLISKDPSASSSSSPLSSEQVAADNLTDAKTLETLANMRNIKLDGRIFEDPAFQALISTDREIVKEPVGRTNPFAPVGADTPLDQLGSAQDGASSARNPQRSTNTGQ